MCGTGLVWQFAAGLSPRSLLTLGPAGPTTKFFCLTFDWPWSGTPMLVIVSIIILSSQSQGTMDRTLLSLNWEFCPSALQLTGLGKLLWAFTSTGILASTSTGICDHILLSHNSGSHASDLRLPLTDLVEPPYVTLGKNGYRMLPPAVPLLLWHFRGTFLAPLFQLSGTMAHYSLLKIVLLQAANRHINMYSVLRRTPFYIHDHPCE
jgi:hypothetical protein